MNDRLDQIEQLLASAARYAESANQRVDELAANQQTHEAMLQALLAERQENRQQVDQLRQIVAQGQQRLDRLDQWTQGLHQQLAMSQTLMATQQQQMGNLSLMLGNLQELIAAQQQELALQRQQLEDQRRTNAAALERLDAILTRLMDRLDNLEAA